MPIPYLAASDEEIFPYLNLALPAWILLCVAPKSKITAAYVNLAAAGVSLLYLLLLLNIMFFTPGTNFSYADMFDFPGVTRLMKLPEIVLPGWAHYIAFDLWTGRWIAMDSIARRFPRLLLAPILVITLMAGPVGLLLYLLVRGNWHAKHKTE